MSTFAVAGQAAQLTPKEQSAASLLRTGSLSCLSDVEEIASPVHSFPCTPSSKGTPPSSPCALHLPSISGKARSGSCPASRKLCTRARLTVTAQSSVEGLDLEVDLSEGLIDGTAEHRSVPIPCDTPVVLECSSSRSIVGALQVGSSPSIPFGVQVDNSRLIGDGTNFVSAEYRQRTTVAFGTNLKVGSGKSATGDGFVIETAITNGYHAEMAVSVRAARKKELTRLAQEQALLNAMENKRYGSLLAQISRSRSRKVETALIQQANRLLKSMRPKEGSYLTHAELGKMMKWKRVTVPHDATCPTYEHCAASASCPCNQDQAQETELCDIYQDSVGRALEGVVPQNEVADKWLFKALVKAALQAPEGCVWKSGGKFLLSNEERNQSPSAIMAVLTRDHPDSDAGRGVRALVEHTEREYGFRVTAVQLNFHVNQTSSHKQHRDIYGAGQKGGINCTCSFMKCTGTVCYSLGSSRQVLCETISDKRSFYEPCCDECTGSKTFKWMHSGSAMYFNAPWNNNHTHGVPQLNEECGPRISVALLCA